MGLGGGTNNFTDLITAKHLIQFALEKHCKNLQIFGDLKIVCNWINKTSNCYSHTLRPILDEAHRLISFFDNFSCCHIYRKHNSLADQLSKELAVRPRGSRLIHE